MSNLPHQHCPQWCDRRGHHEYDGGVDHRSASTRLSFADFTLETALVRPDCDVPARSGESELYMEFTVPEAQATIATDADGGTTVTISFSTFFDEVTRLVEHVTEQRFRARLFERSATSDV